MKTLGALLLNPPTTDGQRTRRHLEVAASLLDCDRVEIANLFAISTQDVTAMNLVGRDAAGWLAAQPHLCGLIARADVLVAGWGVRGLTGLAAQHQRAQLRLIADQARLQGRTHVWTVGGQPRHPSRWHQFVSDRHGRTQGGSLPERLTCVLSETAISDLVEDAGREVAEERHQVPRPATVSRTAAPARDSPIRSVPC